MIINGGTFASNIYGGGNYGTVGQNTTVKISNATIKGSAYAGGNGSLATVKGNTSINVSGNTIIGTESSKAPLSGSLFGGGNAAATGLEKANNSTTIVNITGGTIYGNVYGGANTSVLYGTVELNIGYALVDPSLKKGDIKIVGTVCKNLLLNFDVIRVSSLKKYSGSTVV